MKTNALRIASSKLVENNRITGATAAYLDTLEPADAGALSGLFAALKFSVQSQREIVGWLDDISQRDDITINDILLAINAGGVIGDKILNPPQKADSLRERLHAMRFPEIAAFLADLKEKQSRIRLPGGVRLSAVSPLEECECRLDITFRSAMELEEQIRLLRELVASDNFREWADCLYAVKKAPSTE
jgi:hypothetical protein